MDVEKTGRDVTEKKLFSFTESTADHFLYVRGKGGGHSTQNLGWRRGGGWGF